MVRRRVLGKQLRQLREQAGLTLEEAAPKLHFSVSKLSRVENAQVVIDIHWVKSMLDVYDAGGARWTELLELAEEANQPGWWQAYGLGNNSYIAFETEATRVLDFTVTYVPGLLQTADYARALMRAVAVPRTAEQLENEIAARMHRQQRLTSEGNHLELVAVIDEPALHRPVGGDAVLRERRGLSTLSSSRSQKRSRCTCCPLMWEPTPRCLLASRSSVSATSKSPTWPTSNTRWGRSVSTRPAMSRGLG
jgi:transcriptional regulator with XRE-family HTH domain